MQLQDNRIQSIFTVIDHAPKDMTLQLHFGTYRRFSLSRLLLSSYSKPPDEHEPYMSRSTLTIVNLTRHGEMSSATICHQK